MKLTPRPHPINQKAFSSQWPAAWCWLKNIKIYKFWKKLNESESEPFSDLSKSIHPRLSFSLNSQIYLLFLETLISVLMLSFHLVIRTLFKRSWIVLQGPPLNRITSGQHKSDNNNRMIQLTDNFVYCFWIMGPVTSDYNKRLILLSF